MARCIDCAGHTDTVYRLCPACLSARNDAQRRPIDPVTIARLDRLTRPLMEEVA